MWTAASSTRRRSCIPTLWGRRRSSTPRAATGWSGSCRSPPTRCTGMWRAPRHVQKTHPCDPAAPMRPAKPRPTSFAWPTIAPTPSLSSSPAAPTTTAPFSFRRSSFPSCSVTRWRASPFRSTVTAPRSATGCMWKTTATPSSPSWIGRNQGASTTSAPASAAPTWRSSAPPARRSQRRPGCGRLTWKRSSASCPIVPHTTGSMPWTSPASSPNYPGGRAPALRTNCAAFVRVDDCEDHPETAFLVNAVGALYVARGCRESNALCVYISTDYVFDGQKGAPYTEEDCPRPLNVYGASKLAGETLVQQACPRSLVVRLASVFGATGARSKGGNFVEAIIAKAQRADPIRVVDDIRMSPTYSRDAASGLEALLRREITGVIHLTNSGACTWYEFARAVLDYAGAKATLEAVSSHQDGARAHRPKDSTLGSARLLALHVDRPRPWQEALRAYLIETGRAR